MLIDFPNMEETIFPNFKGGEKEYAARRFSDGQNAIMRGRLMPGASIGTHTHETSSEMIFILSGTASIVCDGTPETLSAGQCHYCPKGSTHTMKNNGPDELTFFAVVPEQYFNFTAEDIISFKVSSGDYPVTVFEYDGKELAYYNRIHPRDGGQRFPDGFFETKFRKLTTEQDETIRSALRSIDFTALRTDQAVRSPFMACGFVIRNSFSCKTIQGLNFEYLTDDVPPAAIRNLFSLLCDICGIDSAQPIPGGHVQPFYAVCPYCKGATYETGHYCRKCGKDLTKNLSLELSEETIDFDETSYSCPYCNVPVAYSDAFCYSCGERLPYGPCRRDG